MDAKKTPYRNSLPWVLNLVPNINLEVCTLWILRVNENNAKEICKNLQLGSKVTTVDLES